VAIFSQITLHQFWRPWGPNSILIKNDVSCAVCETRSGDCPDGTKNCINNISVDEVLGKALSLLKRMDGAR
jgi:ADP-heptose:LPS heptosyltransferase